MIVRTYKNNNVTVRRDDFDAIEYAGDTAIGFGMNEFVDCLVNSIDSPDVYAVNVDQYPFWDLVLVVNGAPRVYWICRDDAQAFLAGKTVRLKYQEDYPLFTLPAFYKYAGYVRKDGVKGTVYTFCDPIPEDTAEDMRAAGCDLLVSQCQYAPEIKHSAAFVPYGTCFSFC